MLSWPVIVLLGSILCIALFVNVRTPKFIGSLGQHDISYKLKRLGRAHYTALSDILLPSHGGRISTTQIDHLVVSTYGIFCIETKTLSGSIEGEAGNRYWTQNLSRKSYQVYNPLWQNYGHIKALERIIGSKMKSPIVSLVAFPTAEHLAITGTDAVSDARGTIEKLASYRVPLYSSEERLAIVRLVEASRLHGRTSYRKHVREVRTRKV